jgi:hypothetical protein
MGATNSCQRLDVNIVNDSSRTVEMDSSGEHEVHIRSQILQGGDERGR